MRKIIGYTLIVLFFGAGFYLFVQNIIDLGWYFILGLVISITVLGLLVLGLYLIQDKD